MHLLAYLLLVASLMFSVGFSIVAVMQIWQGRTLILPWMEKAHIMVTALMTVSSFILLWALVNYDFTNVYVASYTSLDLATFYRMTAFWAGQAGSLLFWAWSVAIFGVFFLCSDSYQSLSEGTKLWFWLIFLAVMAFFLLLLTAWSNPFKMVDPAPADGNGLNPLLQNPGMIFHPPLLFLGYGGFTIPGCLALAQALNGTYKQEGSWTDITRNFILIAWLTLTAGIILGGWWSYMELGWGGYWAWDPVENASLIPWLVASAFLHTSVIETRRNKLHRINIFLIALTSISAFFATYLVRSGVVDSLHAFGDGGVGTPLLAFIILFTFISLLVAIQYRHPDSRPLSDIASREGFLVIAAWVLMTLGIIILIATMWPVFSKFWSENPVGLEPAFYNRVCLPLFVILSALLMVCPWLGWKGGIRDMKKAGIVGVAFAVSAGILYTQGFTLPMAVAGGATALAGLAGIILLFATEPAMRKNMRSIAAYGVHVGLALTILGVAISGPYKVEAEGEIKPGESMQVGDYTFTYKQLHQGSERAYIFIQADLEVTRDGKFVGIMQPQRRLYHKFQRSAFSEAATVPSLGNELYGTLLGADEQEAATLKLSVNPLVNWVWIGGTLMCLFPLLGLTSYRNLKRREEDAL
ncbi:cytochrome c biogenesis protein CcsA [Desulfovibrio mangrovi]|uniref:heme lyase CcmF/NrfE family subunit n=1 Tax=Desulfovibrio mangrovi TaxID=2976983 RepID=UPI002247CF79|nr:cytochrome c-type biogenesis CcmF C-terminal domain-containing protein [Desulfovibrio mangrovi]UZP67925.1 cytochrome c biogenesis protein CcsA [Desulfovibrio mangrovi]